MRFFGFLRQVRSLNERGATLAEQTVVLPLWIAVVFLLRDVFFIGYTWASLQYSVNEAIRKGIIGTDVAYDSASLDEKIANVIDLTRRKALATQLRTGLINPAGASANDVETNSEYGWNFIAGLSSSDVTAYQDITTNTTIAITDTTDPSEPYPIGWWKLSLEASRTLKSSEGKLTPLSGAVLKLALGTSELTLKAKGEGRIEKPLS